MERRFDLITLFGDGEASVWSQRYRKGGSQKCGKPLEARREYGLCSQINRSSEPGWTSCWLYDPGQITSPIYTSAFSSVRQEVTSSSWKGGSIEQRGRSISFWAGHTQLWTLGPQLTRSVTFPVRVSLTSGNIKCHLKLA